MTTAVSPLPDLTPGGRLAKLTVRGRALSLLAQAATGGTITVSMSEVSTIDLTIVDPDLDILASGVFRRGVPMSYAGLGFVVTTRQIADANGVPTLAVTAMDAGAQKARGTRGELVRRDLSPSTYVQIGARDAGLTAVVQPTPARRHVTRKAPGKGQPAESEYDVWQRLADELGFVCFVVAGVVYFAQPTWLHTHLPAVDVDWRTDPHVLGLPTATETVNDPSQPITADLSVTDSLAERLLPGWGARLLGVPTFDATLLVTQTQIPLDDSQACTVNTAAPVNPTPSAKGSGSSAGGGTATAAKFVTAALGEVGHGDPAPGPVNPAASTVAHPSIDGGELIAWAAEQAGATGVNTTPAGIWSQCSRAGRTVSLAAGVRLRGAILFAPGDAAISLGDGRAIAARGGRYAIVSASSGWTAAAKVVGVAY